MYVNDKVMHIALEEGDTSGFKIKNAALAKVLLEIIGNNGSSKIQNEEGEFLAVDNDVISGICIGAYWDCYEDILDNIVDVLTQFESINDKKLEQLENARDDIISCMQSGWWQTVNVDTKPFDLSDETNLFDIDDSIYEDVIETHNEDYSDIDEDLWNFNNKEEAFKNVDFVSAVRDYLEEEDFIYIDEYKFDGGEESHQRLITLPRPY